MKQTIEWLTVMDNPPEEEDFVVASNMRGNEVHICRVEVAVDDDGHAWMAWAYDANENTIEDFEPYYWTPIPCPKGILHETA